jgi:hypothetical protein
MTLCVASQRVFIVSTQSENFLDTPSYLLLIMVACHVHVPSSVNVVYVETNLFAVQWGGISASYGIYKHCQPVST